MTCVLIVLGTIVVTIIAVIAAIVYHARKYIP